MNKFYDYIFKIKKEEKMIQTKYKRCRKQKEDNTKLYCNKCIKQLEESKHNSNGKDFK
jgi:hypothetical protein